MTASGDGPLLALNFGSATLKVAAFASFSDLGGELSQPVRRLQIASKGPSSTPEALLARVSDALDLRVAPKWVGHRIVHGGDAGTARILDADEVERLQALAAFAPLHQPPALALVRSVSARWPQAWQCAAFDTVWHASLPASARRLPVPKAWDALGIRRYGFHGLAFASAMRLLGQLDPGAARGKVVLAHLGGGASLCAVKGGRSFDTTMATTPLDGLPMPTRSGSLDPGAMLYLLRNQGLSAASLEQALYHECGLLGISGLSGDTRELIEGGSQEAMLALQVFALRVAQGIASMATSLGGMDHLVFSGGIGAGSDSVRKAIVGHLSWLGVELDHAANVRGDARLQQRGCRTGIWRIEVNEEIEIAAACASVVR